jgi:DNA polymerase (family 10)
MLMSDGSESDISYIDEKGRTRWRRNDEIAEKLKELHDLLVIGGYDPSHAARYPKLAYTISRHPESIVVLHQEGRLRELPGVAKTVETILGEFIETGTSDKIEQSNEENTYLKPPRSVLELTAIPGLGAQTARRLYTEFGIDNLVKLDSALTNGTVDAIKGLGPKLRQTVRERVASMK